MPQYRWDTAPDSVRNQVKRFVRDLRAVLGENLIGMYLHGSLAMGCFNPEGSDIDLLVAVRRRLPAETRRLLAGLLLTQSGAPRPLEVSFVTEGAVRAFRHPLPYELHFSEAWRTRFEANLSRLDWELWGDNERVDPDLAAHITILRERGVVLYGPPARELFPPVPEAAYRDALLFDYASARDAILQSPVYGVLNMLRVYWYLLEGRISSKDEAGLWALQTLPDPDLQDVVAVALAWYRGDAQEVEFPAGGLERFARFVDAHLQPLRLERTTAPLLSAEDGDSPLACLRCRTQLEFVGVRYFLEGDRLHLYACPTCGKAEFYFRPVGGLAEAPDESFQPGGGMRAQQEHEESLECLACGHRISPDHNRCDQCGWTWR